MKLRIERQAPVGEAVFGQLYVDDVKQCLTLERTSTLTPVGVYPLALTISERCEQGILWSPDDACRLLLVTGVPGRSGIRLHAANDPLELDGCTAVGVGKTVTQLVSSRPALTALMARVVPTLAAGTVEIEYQQAQPHSAV